MPHPKKKKTLSPICHKHEKKKKKLQYGSKFVCIISAGNAAGRSLSQWMAWKSLFKNPVNKINLWLRRAGWVWVSSKWTNKCEGMQNNFHDSYRPLQNRQWAMYVHGLLDAPLNYIQQSQIPVIPRGIWCYLSA